jgi:hypothetical protein
MKAHGPQRRVGTPPGSLSGEIQRNFIKLVEHGVLNDMKLVVYCSVTWKGILNVFTWLSRNVRQVWEGGLWRRTRYLLTLVSPMSIPSLSNSP